MDMVTYGLMFVGTPYVYGGNSVLEGVDCSGFVCELLRSDGHLKYNEDLTSQGIFDRFVRRGNQSLLIPRKNALLFFGASVSSITHVAVALDAEKMLEAGGGDSTTTDAQAAADRNAMVRVRKISARRDLVGVFGL